MKQFLFSLIMLFAFYNTKAQNSNLDYKYALKIYNLSSYEQSHDNALVDTLTSWRIATKTFHFVQPTIAFQWKSKKQNFRELELISFYINKTTQSLEQLDSTGKVVKTSEKKDVSSSGFSFRYEYILIFKKLKTNKFSPSIGFAANPFLNVDHFIPELSNAFKSMKSTSGVRGFVIPRLSYFMGSRFYLDLNIPICVMDFAYQVNQSENPNISENQRRISNLDFSLFPNMFSVRLGLGFKI